ncbi:hypothetical protein [Pseudomonas sp. PMCC200344]|uniref:hypothetical protein n=1 Tax=Pseudomonas sp. PMCC200344 TaxID=3042028 RepID=UPI0024B33117|nr:hypothetical protein [Pseudomonas sp. PMCC200344]
MISAGRRRLLVTALWIPLVVLLLMVLGDRVSENSTTVMSFETFGLVFGIPAYIIFALSEMRLMRGKNEQQILNRIWLGPLVFIPFYAAPWMLFRVAKWFSGHPSGGAMIFEWVAYVPTLLVVGYVVSGLTVALYRTVF